MDSSFSVPKANKSPSTSLENLMDTMFSSSYVCKATTSIAIKSEGRSKWVGGVLSHSTLVKSRSGTASQFPFFLIFWCLGFVVGLGRTQKGSVLCLESWLIAVLKLISLMKPYLCTGLVYTWDYDPYGIHCTVSKWWATSTLDVGGIQLLCYLWGGLKWAAWF